MEPPGPHVRGGAKAADDVHLSAGQLRAPAAAAAAALALTSSGEVVLLAALLCVAGADAMASAATVLALAALAVRWGSTSLDAISGAQAVLGPGGAVGSVAEVLVVWAAAAALVLGAPRTWPGAAFAATAALAVAGPSGGGVADIALRPAGMLTAVAVTLAVGRRLPASQARSAAVALGAAALVVALVA